jgi:hypothetical protein
MKIPHGYCRVQVLCLAQQHDCHSLLWVLKPKHLAGGSNLCHLLNVCEWDDITHNSFSNTVIDSSIMEQKASM